MSIWVALSAAVVGYLFGSVSFARIVGRLIAPEEDLTTAEIEIPNSDRKLVMTTVSATSISMRKGPRWGCITSIMDMAKAVIPLLLYKQYFPDQPYYLIAAGFTVLGHNWPVFHNFKGGRGLSTVIGGMLFIDWLAIIVTNIAGMILGIAVFKDALLAYAGGLILLIPWLWFRTEDPWHLAYAIFVNLSFWVAMLPEIRQIMVIKKESPPISIRESLKTTEMGKGLEKFERFFKSNKNKETGEEK